MAGTCNGELSTYQFWWLLRPRRRGRGRETTYSNWAEIQNCAWLVCLIELHKTIILLILFRYFLYKCQQLYCIYVWNTAINGLRVRKIGGNLPWNEVKLTYNCCFNVRTICLSDTVHVLQWVLLTHVDVVKGWHWQSR